MVVKKADPDVAPTTSGSKSKNSNKNTIPDYKAINETVRDYINRYKIDLTREELPISTLRNGVWKDSKYHPEFFVQLKKNSGNKSNIHPDIYLSTGTFKKGSLITEGDITKGRTANNLQRIIRIPLDADTINYLAHNEGLSFER